MRFGLFYLPTSLPASPREGAERLRALIDQVCYAERLGFHTVWLAEHHFQAFGGLLASPVAVASAIAECAPQIRIGTAVALLPYHNPIRLAEDYATLDLLSQGRLEFGVGAGFVKWEALNFGLALEEIRDRFREHLEIILAAWTQPAVTYHGRFHRIAALSVWPKPLQEPHPPVWLGATATPESFQMAGRLGLRLLLIPFLHEIEALRAKILLYRDAWNQGGHNPAEMRIGAVYHLFVGEQADEARAEAAPGVMEYIDAAGQAHALTEGIADPASYSAHLANRAATRRMSYEELVDQMRVIVGDPKEVAEKIRFVSDQLFLTDLAGDFALGGLSDASVRASMRRFMEQVVPILDGAPGGR